MLINELELGTPLKIIVGLVDNNKTLSFNTKIHSIYTGETPAVIVQAIRYQEKLLNFTNCKAKIEVVVNDRPYIFKAEQIVTVNIDNQNYHLIISKTDANPVNRRNAKRYQMFADAVVRVGTNSRTYKCNTHDISATGMSFVINEDANIQKDDDLYSTFESQGLRGSIIGKVKRVAKVEDNKTLIGCEISSNTSLVEHIVGVLMRKQAGKHNENSKRGKN